jgi:hypothetical protein
METPELVKFSHQVEYHVPVLLKCNNVIIAVA